MSEPVKILLQTTIPYTDDDWHVGRFSLLQRHLESLSDGEGRSLYNVTTRNRENGGGMDDPVLVSLDRSDFDELWLFGKQPTAENMMREATGGLASRPEGFVIYLSTQSDVAPAGVFRQKLNYARAVRDGAIVDKRFLPVLYEFPRAMVKDGAVPAREAWRITNPNLGASVDPEFLDREYQKAQHAGATREQVIETAGVADMMQGGPTFTYLP